MGRRRRRDERWVKIGSDALSCSSASVPVRSIFQTRNECSDGNLSGEPTRPVKWDTTFDHISRRKNSITTDLLRVGLPDRVFNSSSFHKTAETRGNNKAEMLEFLIKKWRQIKERKLL